jgi:hypothetical protein
MNEVTEYFGREEPSRTYKWALVLPISPPSILTRGTGRDAWQAIAWFKTRKACEAYAVRVHGRKPYAIARANLAEL